MTYPPVPPELGGPPTSTQRSVRRAPDDVLVRGLRTFNWVGNLTFLATPTCLLLGLWLDWRWFPTALLPLAGWAVAHSVVDQLESELERREVDGSTGCPDFVEPFPCPLCDERFRTGAEVLVHSIVHETDAVEGD